jgi:hypothetical protein
MVNLVETVNEILYEAAQRAGLDELLLIGDEGLVIASYGKETYADLLNLVSIQLQKPIVELRGDSIGADLDELVTTTRDKRRFCFRFFSANDEEYVLAAVFPKKNAYRRATNIAIRRLKKILA